jgi:hypothetical protein
MSVDGDDLPVREDDIRTARCADSDSEAAIGLCHSFE